MPNLGELYTALKKDGAKLPEWNVFKAYLTAPGTKGVRHRQQFYDALKADGVKLPDTYDAFSRELFAPKPAQNFKQKPAPAPKKAVPLTEDKKRQLQADMDLMQADMDLTMRQAELDMQDARERTKKPLNVRKMNLAGGNNIFDNPRVRERKKARYDGGEKTVYVTESGNEYGSRAMADVEQGQLDEARFMRENKRAYLMREKERIEREMNQRRGEVKRAEEEEYKKIWDGPLKYLSSMPKGGGVVFNPSADNLGVWGDKKYKTLNAQLKQVEDALATLDEAEAGKKSDAWIADSSNAWERNAKKLAGFGGGAWRGLAHSVGKISTWDFGITDMETNKSVLDAANAVDKGTEATKEDQELLDLVAYKNMVEKESEPYLGYGYTAGSITGESLPFMLEMAINPASGVGKGAMKASMRGMLKKYGKEKLKSNFKKYLLAKAGARVAGDVAGAHAMALTTGQGRVIADTMRQLTGDVQYGVNDNGQIVYSGRKVDVDGLAEAYLKSFESQAIENHSEMLGEYFAPLLTRAGKAIGKPIGKGLEKLRLGGVNRFIEDVGASKTAKLIDDFSKKTQWNGSIGEYAEEVAGGIENAMIVGDQTLDTDEQTGVFNLEKNIETFLGVGLMGGFMFGAKLASYRGPKRGALQEMEAAGNRVDRALGGKMQARAQWGEWRRKLLLGNEEEKKNTLREIMDNEKLPIQFRNAVADFSRAAQKYEGLCRAEQSKRLEGTADPVGSSLDDAADAGYELNDPQEMTRTRLALENERERMAAYLGVEVDQVDATVGENLFDYVDDLRNRGVTGEELNRVMDYARARSRYEGMQMRLEDDTNTRIDNVHANMARYAHRENGTVQTGAVKTKDGSRPVWIVSGNLVFEGEGKNRSVNPMKSDESIFVIDAKTGQVEMHPATDFVSLGEPVSAEEVNAYYESSVREQMKKTFEANTHAELSEEKPAEDGELAPANETEGAAVEPAEGNATESTAENATEPAKPAYEVGDVVTLETEDGPVSVEVQAVTADGVEVRTDEPWRGQVVQVIPTEEFEGMMKKPVVEAGVGEEESSATESDRYTEGSPERVEAGDNLIVTDEEGNDRSLKVVRRVSMKPSEKGGLEPQEDANGKIVELVDDATGETVRMWDSELAERTKGYMRPQQGVMPSPKSTEGEGVEQAEQAAPAAEPAQPKRDEIPVDEKTGEPVYEAADPGAAWDALVEEAEGDEELAMETVNAMVRDMEEKVKKAKNAKLRAGATAHEKMEAQKERKRHIAEAEERLESWKRIAGVKAERAAAAEASVVESPVAESPAVESPAVESPVAESPVAESPAAESPAAESPVTVETPAAEDATPVQEGAQTPVQEGARGGVQVPHSDSAGQEATQDSVTGTAPVAEQTGTTPKGVEAIPTRKNNKGEEEVLYHKVPVARTMADLYDGGMDQEEIDGFVEANSAEAAREVKRIEGKKPKMTTNKAKYMEAKRAWQAELDEAREKEAYWKEVGKEVKRVTHRDEAPVSVEGRGHEAALGEDMPKDEPMDVYEVVASALGRGRIKITPESFRAETGYSVNDQKKYPGMVASAENGGVSVERAAEMLMEDADMAGFPSDDYTIRQAIIDVLQDGHPAGYISRRREEARRRAAERDEREREEYYQDRYGMNADDGMAYEETAVPNALNQYGGVSEDELAAQSAEAAEAERMKREEDEQGNRAEDGGQQIAGKEEGAGNEAASEVEEMPAAHEPAVDSSMPKTSFTQDEAADFVDKMEARAESVPEMELTIENWDSLFGEDGRVETPIGEVKMGENQFAKLMRQGRNGKLGMIKPTLESPDIIIEQASMAKEGDVTERPSSYLFIKAFTKPDGERFYYFTSVSVSRDGKEVIISNQEKSRNKILRLMTEESVIWRTPNDAATSSAEKQGLDYAHPNNAEDETKGSGITPQSTSSAGKVTESQETEQGNEVASEVEEGGKQMEGEEKTNTFSLSEMDSGKGGRLYQDAAGNTNLVSIPNEVFEAMGMSPVPFSLTESMAEHVLKHKTELGLSSKEDAVRYVVAVMKNADHVRAGDKPGSFVFSVENGRRKVGKRAIAVQVDGSSGKFLGISTSGNERVSNLQKRPLLWEKGVNETSATGSAPANVTSETAEQNGGELDGNASNQSNDLSADKVTESKETEQVGARVKAEGEEAEVSKDETPKEYKYRRNSDIDTLPDGYLRLGKDERGFDVAFYDHPLSRKEVERFHMGPITESNELVGKVYEVTRGLVTITYRVVGAEDGFVLFTENGSFDYRTLPYYKFMDWVVAKGKEVGTEVKASGKAREARAKDGTQPVSESEAGLRDALVDVARAAGVEVVTDSKEGQRVLDEVNGKARLSAKQKRALETASLGNDPRSLTVVSSATGAKVLNNLDALAASLENSATQPKIFLGQVANALGASNKGSSSQYATFETKNGAVVTIRLANHNASTKRMDNAGRNNAISIVVSPKPNEGVLDDGNAHVVEFYYDSIKLRKADGHPLAEIVRSIQQALYSGEYKDTTGLAERQEVNTTFENLREHRVFHGSGAEFEEFDHSHMGEGEGAQAYGWGTYVTEVEGIGRAYARNPWQMKINELESNISRAKEKLPFMPPSATKTELENNIKEWEEELAKLENGNKHLYTVEIPEDNGENYLHWEKPLTREQLSSVAEALKADGWSEAEGNHPTFTKNDNKIVLNERAAGSDVYAELEEAMGSQQKASEFLSSIGFTGISYPAQFRSGGREDNSRNFVIFNEKDAQITDHVRFFKTENGEAYGFTVGGKVYLDPKIATTETAVHELTHLWADMLRKENPKEWKHVVELMKGTPVWDEVKAKYPELKTEDEIADEVLAHYSGRRGAERLRAEQQRLAREEGVSMLDRASAVAAIERVKDALNSFWKKVADLLGIHFKSAEEVADAALADILNGRVKLTAAEGMKEDRKELVAVHNITKDKLKQAMELGGFPMPSIAITKAGVGHTSFGDISLVFDKESINPTDKRNKVYGEDAWTPVFPGVGYKLNDKKTAEIYRRANNVAREKDLPFYNPAMFHPDNLINKVGANGVTDLVEYFKNSYDAKQMYLAEMGNAVTEYVKREEEKYSPKHIRLYEKMLEEIGLERLQNESLEELRDEIKRLYKEYGDVDIDQKPQRVERAYLDGAKRKAVDYALHGNRNVVDDVFATQREIDGRIDQQQFEEWLGEMFSGIVEKKGVRNDKDAYTPSGNARKWEQLYDEITLDNVVAAMQKQAAKGGEGLFGRNIFGSAQAEYKSIDEIRKAAKERIRTINEEEYQTQRSAITDRLSAIEIPGSGSGFLGSMEMEQHIHDAVSKSHTAKGIHKYLKKFYPGITMETAEEIADIVQDIQHMSARYFEAKPYRAVGFDEVKLAVVPSDMDAALKERLEQMGIEVRTYASGDQAQRKRVVDEATEELRIRFQLVGEKGAANMDKAEEATTRLDNLSVAREMEEAFEEKKKRIEKLRKSDSVVVDGNEYLGKYELNSKSAGDYILSSLRRGYKNTDTNELIHISRKSQKVAHHDAENEVHLKSIAYIPQLIEHAIFIDEIPNSKSKNGFDSYRYYVVGFNIGGVDYTVRLTVGVKNGQSYYDHALTKIEKGNLLNLTDGVKADVSEKETAISDVKDKRLLSLLRMNEQENARKIKLATGWERGADGKWRYEVGDIGRMNFLGNARFIRNNPDAQRYGELNYKKLASLLIGGEKLTEEEEEEFSKLVKKFSGELDFNKKPMSKGNQLTLGDYFDADELFAAYPELEDVPVYAEQLEDGVLGYASEADSDFMGFGPVGFMNSLGKPVSSPYKIVVSQDFLEEAAKTLDESVKRRLQSVFIHEIQHLIQEIEGFAKGGSATTYRNHIDELKWGHDVWSWAMEFEAKHQELGKDASREDVYYELVNEFKEDGHEFGDGYAPSREVFDEAYKVWSRRGYDNGWYEAAYNEYQYLTGKFGLGFENNRYYQLAGEVEARNVQSRMDMTAEERRASLAEETEDVAREDQVFIMDGIESANSLGDNTSFENRQQRAVQERGVVPAGLNDASIKVEEIPAHPYEGRWSEARSAAIEDAYLKYSEEREVDGKKVREPKSLVYANHGRRFTYTISRGSLKESVNPKQIDKSKKGGASPGVHLAVLNHLDKVIANSIEVEEHPDYIKGKDGVRGPENGYTRGMLVHRFVGAVRIDGQEYIVKTTMHEHSRAEQGTRQYAYDVTKIAVLNVETPNTATGLTTATKGVLPLANVLNGFEKSYDPGKNLLEESKKEDRRFAESVGEQETDDDLYRNVFGGNSGYVGYSMSRRASKARSEGRFPKGDFKREYGLTDTMLNLLVENGAVSNSEWHHTSMFGNRTPFYGWEDYALEAFEEHTEELNRIARSRKLTASEKQEAVDKIMNESMDKKRAIEESAAGEQQRLESEYAVYRKEAESGQPARYEASNGAVVVKGTEGLEVYNSQGERLTKRNGKLERNAAIEEYSQKFAPAGFNQWMKDTHPEVDNSAYREVEQGELLDELRKASKEGRTVRVYRTMQVIDGKLYSPMEKKVAGQETSEIKFRWEAAEEHPELARRGDGSKAMPNEDSFYITIDKGQGKGALTVAYNPYTHTSRTVLNDQFSSAFVRPNLVVVEVEVPESELEGLYKAEKAKDSVGEMSWHSGAVSGKLAELGNPRKVILSRYDRPVRILTKKEEAELIAKQLEGTGIAMPYNLVTPQVREELEKQGVKIDEKPSGSVSKNASFGKAEYVTDEQIEAMNGRLQANAVSSPEAMTEAARALSEQLGVPVEIVTDVDSITHPNEAVEVKRRRAKGWYDKRTGKVAIVVPNHLDVEDVAATVFHEVVAHRGLRELVGEQGYDEFLMEVFNHSKADVRERMMALAGKHGWDIPKAVDEYLGGLAERGFDDFSEAERGMWTWLKEKVLEAIDKFIGTLKLPKSVKLGDNELRYLLWRSHENLRAGREGMVKRAMDVAKRYELGLLENEAGERMIAGLETYRSAENRGNTRALPIRERAKAIAHLKPVLVERNEMSKEELRQIYNALPDAVKDGRSISFFHSAFKKNYKEGGLFAQVLPKLNEILKGSVFAYSEKDNRGGEVRPDGTVHKYHPNANAFDNYVGKVEIDGKEYYVRITVQEQQGQVGTHSFFVTSVDVYEKPVNGLSVPNFPSGESDHQRVVDAKLRQFFDEARREDKASEEEDLYRTAYHEAAARDAYERRVKSGLYQSREALQDSMLGLRTAMEEVLKAEGNGYSGRVEDIPGFENAYLGENRLSSVNQAEVDEFGRRLFKPLLEIAASFGSSKEARQALTDYMMAKHGLERNALMRERAKKKAMEELEGDALQKKLDSIEKRDFAGLTALTGKKKVVDAEQAAHQLVADFEQTYGDGGRIDALWKAVRGVTGATLKKMKDSGLITKEQFDEISGMYDFYIPLRGFDGQTAEDVYDYLGHGGNGSAFTSPIKKAEGRKSKADDPFAYMAAMAESAIMQGNRNVLVKQKFLNFVLNHPSDLVSVSDLWLRYDAAAGEWRVAQSGDIAGTEKLEEGDSPEEVERKMAVFEERMQAEAEAHPKEYKRQKEHPEIPYRVVEKQDLREHQVIVKRNGRDYVLTINGSPRAAQALNGLTNPNLDVSGVAGTLMNGVRNTTNYLSQVYTTRNPNFVGSNWARDAIYSNIMAGLKEDKKYGLKFSKAWLEANPRSMKKLYSLYEHGELDMNNEKQRLFAEFMANGGETGYMSFRQIEERKNEIERQLKLYDGKMLLRKGWRYFWDKVDYANRVVENQSRFAAYMASRRSGRTIDRSIYDAKEITVNFNKKGAGSTFYNAKNQTLAGKVAGGVSGIGRFGFAFWNAAIQGTTNFARFVKRNPKKGVAFSLATMALGYVVPLLASIFHDDDDDKEGSGYFDLPDAVRRDNFVFRFPGMDSWITIPLPVEYRALYGLGELTATAMYRASIGMPMTAGEIAGQAMGQISQLMPLDLSEGGGMDFTWGASGNFNALAPSAVKPVAEAWTNKSWTGLPVYKDTPYNKQDPEWTKAFKNTNTFLVKMCKQLNEWTGGDSVKGGAVDLNPAVMEHLLKGYLGGYMQTANQIGKLTGVFGERDNDFRNWPVVSRFLQEGDERTKWRAVTERYFNLKKEAEETDRQLKRYKKLTELGEDHQADIDELIKTDAYKRMEVYDSFENDIQKIQDVLKRNDLSDEERKQVEGELNEIRLELLKAVDELGNLTGLGTGRLGAVTGDLLAE